MDGLVIGMAAISLISVGCAAFVSITMALNTNRVLQMEQESFEKRRQLLSDEWDSQRKIFERNDFLISEQIDELPKRMNEAINDAVGKYLVPYKEAAEEVLREQVLRGGAVIEIDESQPIDPEEEFRRWEAGQ